VAVPIGHNTCLARLSVGLSVPSLGAPVYRPLTCSQKGAEKSKLALAAGQE